jgi:oligoendopeptidase F
MQKVDKYYPAYPSFILRKFELQREMPEKEIESLFTDFLSSPQMSKVAGLIKTHLGRDLRPYDIWYDGFQPRSSISEEELNKKVAAKYGSLDAFTKDLPNILVKLGFTEEQARFIAPRITVDPARGSGHAWGSEMREGKAHLRTRAPKDGMDYKGYNIAIHELGHTVEQTLSIHKVDHHMIFSVPIAAFTEAFAFVFQNRDLELLGMKNSDPDAMHMSALGHFWQTAEIMAVALVEMKIWNWLYDHPGATAVELRAAAIEVAKEIWNRFLSEHYGCRDESILAIYSHMINHPLYLAEYPLGHLIQFQIEKYLEGKNLGVEMERMCSAGNVIPQVWMKTAVGSEISSAPMLDAVDRALNAIG